MSRQLLSRANQLFFGRASLGLYQAGKPGGEVSLTYRYKPAGARAAAFTAGLAAGSTSGTLTAGWGGASGLFPITFSDGEVLTGKFVNGSTAVTFYPASFPQTGGTYTSTSPYTAALVTAVTATISVGGQPPVLGVSNSIFTSGAINLGTPAVPNGSTVTASVAILDVPRNVIAAWTNTAILTVIGTDFYGQPQTEASASGTSFTGKKAFATITSITVSANVTGATVGTGNVLGLPFKTVTGDFASAQFADANDAGTFVQADVTAIATSTTGDVRGTYVTAGTLNGSTMVAITIKPTDPATQVGTFGVTPA